MISTSDYCWFIDGALDGMIEIVTTLGDDLANRRPAIDGANSPFVLLTHCLGVMEYWGGHVVAGRTIKRDRDAEFVASGPVAPLVAHAREVREQFGRDLETLEAGAPPRGDIRPDFDWEPFCETQGGVLIHIYEEFAQHRGQMEGVRDVLLAPWAEHA
ncbi:MAG TPA: DUF664 domain-containing protein [Acidimicrobiia bacterium]|nr:DUF664 domain-containing protein [Acidimicrobiia bacterium]